MEEKKKNQEEIPGNGQNNGDPVFDAHTTSSSSEESGQPKTSTTSPFIEKKSTAPDISEDIEKILKETKLPERRAVGNAKDAAPGRVFDTTIGASATDTMSVSIPKPKTDTKKDEDPKIKSLRTFKDDLQGLVKVKKMSLVKAATLETEKTRNQKAVTAGGAGVRGKSRARFFAILFTVVILVGLGILALLVVFAIQGQRASNAPVVENSSFLFSEQTFTIPIDDQVSDNLIKQLAQGRGSVSLTLGAITRIVPTVPVLDSNNRQVSEREATVAEFLSALHLQTPENFARSFGDSFFLGIHTIDENVPVLILPVLLYQNAFTNMLKWERYINEDLSPLFTKVPYQTIDPDGNISLNGFEDVIIRNYDVRALRDPFGNIKMLYAFPTKDILIIAESPHTFTEALARLRAERRL